MTVLPRLSGAYFNDCTDESVIDRSFIRLKLSTTDPKFSFRECLGITTV